MNPRQKKKPIDYFSFWQLQNKITMFCLIGILLLSALFAVSVIRLPVLNPTHFVLFIIMIPILACIGIATSHSSRIESAKAQREYNKVLVHLSDAEGSEITLDRFFAISSDLMAVAGQDGYLKRASTSLINTLGYSEEVLLSTPFFEFIHPDDREATRKNIEALNLGLRSVGFENRYRAADGTYRTLSWSAAADAELGVRFASARDVTDERNFHLRVQQVMDSVPFMFMVKDRDGLITNCNAAFSQALGVAKESILGRSTKHFSALEFCCEHKEQEVIQSLKPLTFEEVLNRRGTPVRHRSTIFPILDQTGQVISTGKVSVVID
ncbi:PAS domain S-box protein [Bdellovibrio sp. SKB1291214]|uniref:PAS domain-containing protein n=1 Tax=Bdellovibrio sp. SKB1291214 TaxID=1732569 RepID=UPI002240721B|nr:PAS domain S-box protein [Bdellovibrio sp. SKB1291214]UYL09757.1 PAS domain S-box protein [Bdellovibrio sp. SKB1291214]